MSDPVRCPECAAGKHANCTGWALDDRDVEVACPCPDCFEEPAAHE